MDWVQRGGPWAWGPCFVYVRKNTVNVLNPSPCNRQFGFQRICLRSRSVRWPTTVTSKPNARIKFKSLTANSNRSQQIQITHSKLQITHSKLQIAHSKFKSPTANSNRSQQIKVAHSKFKLLTANYKLLTPLGVFGYLQPAVQLNICHTWSRYSLKFACVNLRVSCGSQMDCVMNFFSTEVFRSDTNSCIENSQ